MTPPLRVLQVLYAANRGGAETWLVHLLRHIDRNQVAMDFLVHDRTPGAYDTEIAQLGARIFICGGHRNLLKQWYGLRRIQRRFGPYDVVHSQVDYYGGFVMLLARLAGIRARIANYHNDTRAVDIAAGRLRRLYVQLMKFLVRRFATGGLGTSSGAAATLFGEGWRSDLRWRIHSACVDLRPFHEGVERDAVCGQLGIPRGCVVFGHVGRLAEQKNHEFLIAVAKILAVRDDRVRFLLVGGGPRQRQIEDAIRGHDLLDRFIILAPRDDVPRLMLGAMDFFLFPSHYEGLGLALVEAQAAGLRCFASTAVPTEAVAIPALVQRLPLSAGPDFWAETILQQMDTPNHLSQDEALRQVERSFDIRRNAAELVEFYQAAAL